MTTTLYPYQERGVRRIRRFGGRALLADQMGLGKSIQALTYFKRYVKGRLVIVCPASIKWNWKRECKNHVGLLADVLEGRKPRPSVGLRMRVYIVNYDILESHMNFLRWINPQMVIVDEGHYCKNQKARRTKVVANLCQGIPNVVILTGTPVTNRPYEIYPLISILKPDLFESHWQFAWRYCKPEKTQWGWQYKGAENLDELHSILSKNLMIRRVKTDVLKDLPDKTRHIVALEMDRTHEYKMAERDFIAWLSRINRAKAVRASMAQKLVKTGYLRRLVAECKLRYIKEWVSDVLEDTDEKVIFFGLHKKIVNGVYEHFKPIAVKVDGSVTGIKRQRAIDHFTRNKHCRLFVGNMTAAGTGWNGTIASTVVFGEIGWVPGEHTQAEDRVHRIGQRNPANIYYLIARDTIEEKLCKILQAKQEVLDRAIDGQVTEDSLDVFDLLTKEQV